MDLSLTGTQALIRNSVRSYVRDNIPFSRIRTLEASRQIDGELWHYLAEAGYLALPFLDKYGGSNGDLVDMGILVEELTRRAVVSPVVETLVSALCVETHHLVAAHDGRSPALVLVDAKHAGVSYRALDNISRLPQSNVTYRSVPAMLVAGGDALLWLLNILQAFSALGCLANAQQALDMTTEYVKVRVQFDQPIGAFQAVQHHVANMATMMESCRFLVYEALWKLARDAASARDIAIAKNWAVKTVNEVTMLAHELHGGIGATEEYDLHFFTRRGKDRASAWGSAEETIRTIAAHIGEPTSWI